MKGPIKLRFDHNQEHQIAAVDAVTGIFAKLPRGHSQFVLSDEIVPNLPADELLDEELLATNLKHVQAAAGLPESSSLDFDDGLVLEGVGDEGWRYPVFTVEMETGTGKTYTYLRTIHELKQLYGFRKFIIVVPSVAIYKGVLKSLEMTREHFQGLYSNEILRVIDYDSSEISKLRDFATSQFLEVMVMTMQAFKKASNNIYKRTEKLPGERVPCQYIQETRPILILDESQNYASDLSLQALRTMHPLLAIKYSATPGVRVQENGETQIKYDNLLHRLTPVTAFKKNLVKRIEVFGVTEEFNPNAEQLIILHAINRDLTADFSLLANTRGQFSQKEFRLKKGADLEKKTGNPHYKGFLIDEISRKDGKVAFTNGISCSLGGTGQLTASKEEIWRVQIEETVRRHIERQEQLLAAGIKVLSLFFVERVAHYTDEAGIAKRLFDEAFEKYKDRCSHLRKQSAKAVRQAYFATKITKAGEEAIDIEELGRNAEQREAAKRAFDLIMTKKEQLLSLDESVSFIFAHSALREGWDNPNVFQICTLRESGSDREKRQSIGRGMRLCVNQDGERVTDPDVNVLTVVANESYDDFCRGLQTEYAEAGEVAPQKPSDARRQPARRNDAVYKSAEFEQFWKKVNQKTTYELALDMPKLVNDVVARMSRERIPPPRILVRKGKYVITHIEIRLERASQGKAQLSLAISDTIENSTTSKNEYLLGDELARKLNDERLRGFKITEIVPDEKSPKVVFANGKELTKGKPIEFDTESGQRLDERTVVESKKAFPVFNLIDRACRETFLTRKTILDIFKALSNERKKEIFSNPEGFAGVFITSIREVLADHIARNVAYDLAGRGDGDQNDHFPEERQYPQKELIPGSKKSLYDYIQVDSDVERSFVERKLNEDEKVVLFFKFPPQFKVLMPRFIGNYVPDWGVVREDEDGRRRLELVRETKGSEDEKALQFPNEKRKIWCAKRHFKRLGIDYRQVTHRTEEWWTEEPAETPELAISDVARRILQEVKKALQFGQFLPVYSLEAAGGKFGDGRDVHEDGWLEIDLGRTLSKDMFVAKVVGRSMEPKIPDGAYCVFAAYRGGSRQGKIVLAQHHGLADPETGGSYTVKRYQSEKKELEGELWGHTKIVLESLNPDFKSIKLTPASADEFKIIAEFVAVVGQ
jgi:type III restriction enzyme